MAIGTPVSLGSQASTTNVSTTVLTTSAGVTAGDSIIVQFGMDSSTRTLSSVTDSAGNTYNIDQGGSTTGRRMYIASCHNANALASGQTITATTDAATSSQRTVSAFTVSGLATSSTLDKVNNNSGTSATWTSGATGTLSQADELAVGACWHQSANAHTPDSGWSEAFDISSGLRRHVVQYQVTSATTSLTAGATNSPSSSGSYAAAIATYKGSGGGPVALSLSSAATADGTLALSLPPQLSLTSGAAASGTLDLWTPPQLALSSSAAASATLTLSFPDAVNLDLSAAVTSDATLTLTIPGAVLLDLDSTATASASLTLTIPGEEPPPAVGPAQIRSQLKCKLTSLHYPAVTEGDDAPLDAVPSRTLALLLDARDIDFYHPLNDSREASCTIHFEDPAAQFVEPYASMLHITFAHPNGDDILVFWGILTQPEWNDESQTIRINAVDPSLRLKHHYLRRGDEALNSPDHPDLPNLYDRQVPVGLTGLNMLIDAGDNIADQTARGVPELGILHNAVESPVPDVDTADKVRFQRGREVWDAILELTSLEGAPDFELQPIDGAPGYYCQLLTGVDLNGDWWTPPYPSFQSGFGKDNCRINYRPGSRITTHSHYVSEDYNLRVTAVDVEASRHAGVYVDWEAASFDGGDSIANAASLLAKARRPIGAYGAPVEQFDIVPNLDCDLQYYETFVPGSYVRAQARWGRKADGTPAKLIDATCRVVACRLHQEDAAANVRTELEVAYSHGPTDADEGDDT